MVIPEITCIHAKNLSSVGASLVSVLELQLTALVVFLLAFVGLVLLRRRQSKPSGKKVKAEDRTPQRFNTVEVVQSRKGALTGDVEQDDFRLRYPARFVTDDGHHVRSKAEVIIANWLHHHKIRYEYEKKIPGEYMMCDYYLPDYDIYIEYWGGSEPEYEARKKEKLASYHRQGLKLISLNDDDVENLERKLTQKLRALGIRI